MTQQNEDKVKITDEAIPEILPSEASEVVVSNELDLPEVMEQHLIDGSGAYPEENTTEQNLDEQDNKKSDATKKKPRFVYALVAMLALTLGVGGVAYATGVFDDLVVDETMASKAEESTPEWTTLVMSKAESEVYPGIKLTQNIQVKNNDIEGKSANAYVRVYVAVPKWSDGDSKMTLDFNTDSWKLCDETFDINIDGAAYDVSVLDYKGILATGSVTPNVLKENGVQLSTHITSGELLPIYAYSQAVQAGIWKNETIHDGQNYNESIATSVLNKAFGAPGTTNPWETSHTNQQ